MAATVNLIQIDGGRGQISSYNAVSAAVNIYLPVSKDHVALSTDQTFIRPKRTIVITDFVAGAATGTVQVEIDGSPTPTGGFIDYAQHQASNNGRPKLNIVIPANSDLRLKVVVALPA